MPRCSKYNAREIARKSFTLAVRISQRLCQASNRWINDSFPSPTFLFAKVGPAAPTRLKAVEHGSPPPRVCNYVSKGEPPSREGSRKRWTREIPKGDGSAASG
ncbi:hypothetical protein KM043_011681 [Ampulex compressa]|nr:hypothetical protein KM043_011681 [Ampulex compressa]